MNGEKERRPSEKFLGSRGGTLVIPRNSDQQDDFWGELPMRTCTTVATLRSIRRSWVDEAGGPIRVGFVPTMGGLHSGHQRMLEQARHENDRVVLSVFVNPMQFVSDEDYEHYPKDWAGDQGKAREAGADLLFAPTVGEFYPISLYSTCVGVDRVVHSTQSTYFGEYPWFVNGVATAIFKFCQLVQPYSIYLERRDVRQLATVERMFRDLHMPIRVVKTPVMREHDGLACGSRNCELTAKERQRASVFYGVLLGLIGNLLGSSSSHFRDMDPQQAVETMERDCQSALEQRSFVVKCVALRTYPELEVPHDLSVRPLVFFATVSLGSTYLMDSIWITEGGLDTGEIL